jgi:S1-C subfamily serine protease
MTPGILTAIAASLLSALAEPAAGVGAVAIAEFPGALSSLETEQASLFARVAPSVVLIMRDGASGSGFVVGRDGLVLTNAHVVGDGDEVSVQLVDGRRGPGHVVARATGALDLALVRAPFADLTPLVAGDPDALRAGTFAATVGHGGGAAWTFSTGLVANPRPLGDGAPIILAQMALRPGSSGGPIVDRLGRAVAVVTTGTRDASGVTFAIRVDAAVAAFPQLEQWGSSPARVAGMVAAASAHGDRKEQAGESPGIDREPRVQEVAQLSGEGAAPRALAMFTVWEAPPRSARRPSASARPIGPMVPSHSVARSCLP